MAEPESYPTAYADSFERGFSHGETVARALRHNLRHFWLGVRDRGLAKPAVLEAAETNRSRLPDETRAELYGMAQAASVSFREVLAFNLFEESLVPDGCTVAIAAGSAGATGDTVFFKQSDKKGAEEFVGEDYHQHQQINVVRVEDPPEKHRIITITPAGSTAVKMGVNEHGVAIGANMSRTVTFDEEGSSSKDWAAASRGEYMRQGLFHGTTAKEVAAHIVPLLYDEPMSSPGNIDIADADEAVIIEGEFTHLASEWVSDGVVARTNKFQVLDDLARPEPEIPSSYARYDRAMAVLTEHEGQVTPNHLRDLSIDHTNGPGLNSICRHEEHGYTDETSLSSAVFRLDGDDPAASELYLAVGKPCHSWRSEEGDGWVAITLGDGEDAIPERFLNGEAWLDNYDETPYDGAATPADLSG